MHIVVVVHSLQDDGGSCFRIFRVVVMPQIVNESFISAHYQEPMLPFLSAMTMTNPKL